MQFQKIILAASLTLASSVFAQPVPYLVQSLKASEAPGYLELIGPGRVIIDGKNQPYGLGDSVFINISNINALSNIGSNSTVNQHAKKYSKNDKSLCDIQYETSHYSEAISVMKLNCRQLLELIKSAQ